MAAAVLLTCDVPVVVEGQDVGTCARSSVWVVATIDEARTAAARSGWRRMAAGQGGGDQCPSHPGSGR